MRLHQSELSAPSRGARLGGQLGRKLAGDLYHEDQNEQMSLSVRTAVATDAQRVSELLAVLGYELTPVQVERGRDERGAEVLVAERDGATRGVLAMYTRRHFQLALLVSSIDALVVDPACRSEGVGAALVRAAVEVAESSGATLVDLNSAIERIDARRFYERHGFDVASHHFRRWLSPS